jgi:hypothetical protein
VPFFIQNLFFNYNILYNFTKSKFQNDVVNVCLLGFARAMQYPSKFQRYFMEPIPTCFLFIYLFAFKTFLTHPPTTPPVIPHQPIHLHVLIKNRIFLIYLLTYKFKMHYCHPHPPSHPPSIFLPTNILGRYLPNPTYMVTPTYMPGWHSNRPPNSWKQSRKNKMKLLHGTWSCSSSKINEGKIKVIVFPLCKGIANRHWL